MEVPKVLVATVEKTGKDFKKNDFFFWYIVRNKKKSLQASLG